MNARIPVWKRFAGVLASLALAMMLVPAVAAQQAQAAPPITKINDVTVDLSSLKPVPGREITELTTVPDTAGYGVPNEEWYVDEPGYPIMAEGDIFEQGKTYLYTARLEARDGYEFDSTITLHFTGGEWVDGYTAANPAVYWKFDAEMPEVDLEFGFSYTVPVYDLGARTVDLAAGKVLLQGEGFRPVSASLLFAMLSESVEAYDADSVYRIDLNKDGAYDLVATIDTDNEKAEVQALDGRSNILESAALDLTETQAASAAAMETTTFYSTLVFKFTERVDITALKAVVAGAEALKQGDYTPASWKRLEDAVTAGKAAAAAPATTVAQGTAAAAAIESAKTALVKRADKAALAAAIAGAEVLAESDYTPVSWAPFSSALASARAVVANDDASQADADEARTALQTAQAALEKSTWRVALDALVEEVGATLDTVESDYTPESLRKLKEAIDKADTLLADPATATAEALDAALREVSGARAALVAVEPAAPDKPAAPTASKPKKVTVKSVKAGKRSVTVKWKKVSGATKYKVAYRVKGAKTWKTATAKKAAVSKKVGKLKKGKRYQVKVRAGNAAGWGKWSKAKASEKVR